HRQPRDCRADPGAVLRADARVLVEGAEAHRHDVAVGPLRAEEARPALDAEDLAAAAVLGLPEAEQALACEHAELLWADTCLRLAVGSRVLPAARAVAVVRPDERRIDLEADTAAEAAA